MDHYGKIRQSTHIGTAEKLEARPVVGTHDRSERPGVQSWIPRDPSFDDGSPATFRNKVHGTMLFVSGGTA